MSRGYLMILRSVRIGITGATAFSSSLSSLPSLFAPLQQNVPRLTLDWLQKRCQRGTAPVRSLAVPRDTITCVVVLHSATVTLLLLAVGPAICSFWCVASHRGYLYQYWVCLPDPPFNTVVLLLLLAAAITVIGGEEGVEVLAKVVVIVAFVFLFSVQWLLFASDRRLLVKSPKTLKGRW